MAWRFYAIDATLSRRSPQYSPHSAQPPLEGRPARRRTPGARGSRRAPRALGARRADSHGAERRAARAARAARGVDAREPGAAPRARRARQHGAPRGLGRGRDGHVARVRGEQVRHAVAPPRAARAGEERRMVRRAQGDAPAAASRASASARSSSPRAQRSASTGAYARRRTATCAAARARARQSRRPRPRLRRTRARGARTSPPSSRRPTAPGRPPARTSDVAAPLRPPPDVCRAAASAPRNQVPRGASTISRAAAARCVASSWPAGLLRPLRTTPATRARRSAHVFASGRNAPAARSFAARYSSRAARQFVSSCDR